MLCDEIINCDKTTPYIWIVPTQQKKIKLVFVILTQNGNNFRNILHRVGKLFLGRPEKTTWIQIIN